MSHYSNPTANAAIGNVDREIRQMQKFAKQISRLRRMGILTAEDELLARKKFTGIYRRFLLEALEK